LAEIQILKWNCNYSNQVRRAECCD